jgi:hypothetical protein
MVLLEVTEQPYCFEFLYERNREAFRRHYELRKQAASEKEQQNHSSSSMEGTNPIIT